MEIHMPAGGQADATQRNQENEGDAGDLQRVRDILFGSQVREIEQRMQALEDDVKAKLDSAREDLQKQSDELESKLVERADSLKKELDEEKDARNKALDEAVEKTRQSVEELEKRFTKLTDQMEEEKADRAELSKLFRHLASELGGGEERPAAKTSEPDMFRELETEGAF